MKRPILTILIYIVSVTTIQAQDNIELFGYFESQIMGAKISNEFYQVQSNKLRVDISADPADNISFGANFDYITYDGKKQWNILEYLSDDITSAVQPEINDLYTIRFSDRQFLDNAYIKVNFSKFDLTAGKQQISLGTGYVWNPLDVFNTKDVLDPTYEQPGHNAVRADVPLGARHTLNILYTPEDTWNSSGKLIQLKGGFSRFDYTLTAAEILWRFHDYTEFDNENMTFLELPQKRRLFGASTVGELLGLGVWAEYGYSDMQFTKDYYELVVGADYTFDFQTFVMVEYYRNTLGKADHKNYDLNDWMRQFASEQKAISRDQVYMFLQHPITDLLEIGTSGILSLSDNSFTLIPTLNYSFSDNMDIMAYLNFNFGSEGKAFSNKTGNSGMLRARIYF
ncbi:hypothetical protein ACFL6O_04275 [candidate division KSB1 bacterium]